MRARPVTGTPSSMGVIHVEVADVPPHASTPYPAERGRGQTLDDERLERTARPEQVNTVQPGGRPTTHHGPLGQHQGDRLTAQLGGVIDASIGVHVVQQTHDGAVARPSGDLFACDTQLAGLCGGEGTSVVEQ